MTIIQLRRATQVQCPPCTGQCDQGRACNAQGASASSELLEEDEAIERRFRATARFWTLYAAAVLLVAVCAGIAHFLPVLQKLASN